MRRIVPLILLLVSAAAALHARQAATVSAAALSRIDTMADELYPSIVEIRRDIHRHPELGFREKRTAALVAEKLRALKFDEVRTGVGVTGVIGILKGSRPGPVVAWRADMDALPVPELNENMPYKSTVPNVKHACGHDGHTAIALGVAEIFSRMRADLPGTVVFLFQPAEEGDPDGGRSGAQRVLDDWPFTNPTPVAIFGLHTQPALRAGQIGYTSGAAMASTDRFVAKIIGKQTHGAMPHTGIDPVPVAAEAIMAFQTIPSRMIDARLPTVVSVGMVNAGTRFNIIADSVTLTGTVRTLDREGPSTVKSRMDTILKGLSSAHGAGYSLEYIETAPVTYNDPKLVAATLPALRAAVGDKLVESPAVMVAEDFAFYQQKIPGFYFFLGVANPERNITAMWHTEYFDLDEEALRVGMKVAAAVLLQRLGA